LILKDSGVDALAGLALQLNLLVKGFSDVLPDHLIGRSMLDTRMQVAKREMASAAELV
jgi:hypothetical protein